MKAPASSPSRKLLFMVLAVAAPLAVLSAYLLVTRLFAIVAGGTSDYWAVAASIAIGALPTWHLVAPASDRFYVMVAYAMVAAVVLTGYGLWFVCGAFIQ